MRDWNWWGSRYLVRVLINSWDNWCTLQADTGRRPYFHLRYIYSFRYISGRKKKKIYVPSLIVILFMFGKCKLDWNDGQSHASEQIKHARHTSVSKLLLGDQKSSRSSSLTIESKYWYQSIHTQNQESWASVGIGIHPFRESWTTTTSDVKEDVICRDTEKEWNKEAAGAGKRVELNEDTRSVRLSQMPTNGSSPFSRSWFVTSFQSLWLTGKREINECPL